MSMEMDRQFAALRLNLIFLIKYKQKDTFYEFFLMLYNIKEETIYFEIECEL